MAQKYTILKVLIQNFSKIKNPKAGFTLIELIFGLLIMSVVGGLAMNAFVQSSTTFAQDKKNIDSNQNLSAILEIIGNDIRQSGEQISNSSFPTIEISQNTITGTTITDSSTIKIRRALTPALTLCQTIAANATPTTLTVADDNTNSTTPKTTTPNCAPLPLQTDTSTPILPKSLREARNYRCKLDDINALPSTTTDSCLTTKASPDLEQLRAAIYDVSNNTLRMFNYTDDSVVTASSKFSITINNLVSQTTATPVDSPIYLIEERIYKLENDGTIKLSTDGTNFTPLIAGMVKFKVSAKLYSDTTAIPKTLNNAPANPCSSVTSSPDYKYTCTFNAATTGYNWKNIAGVKIELQSKYDSTGKATEGSSNVGDIAAIAKDKEKLSASAEYFPRNVLSK
jgi:prepilin-type N-terminal cleavage/methylation domain-containing protein